MDKIEEVLTRSVESVLPDKSGLAKLMAGKKIRVYCGIDPTGPKLHLGHTIPLRKLQQFAGLGHEAILLFGTGTVLAGDPSQRKEARKTITQEEVNENIKDWKLQAEKIVDLDKIQIKQNGDWLLKLTYPEIINIASNISAVQLFKREMFQKRMEVEETIWTHELLYPLLQGYDSVHLDADLEIGGTDQTFNMLIGRELQKKMKSREKYVLTTPLILGTDGQTMSKSSGNCVWLDDKPSGMYGKIMAIPDSMIDSYWNNLTGLPPEKIKRLKPFDAKKQLAHEIAKIFHGQKAANEAEESFKSTFQKGTGFTSQITFSRGATIADIALTGGIVESKSELKRLSAEGAIDLDNKTVTDINTKPKDGQILKLGKKRVIKLQEKK